MFIFKLLFRVIATFYVADYELKPRYYIGVVLAIVVDCALMAASFTFVTGEIERENT